MEWEDIIKYHHNPSYGFGKHYLLLYSIVRGLRAKKCFEFGIGISTKIIQHALRATGGCLTSCAVHSPEESGITKYDIMEWRDQWRFIRGRSEEILKKSQVPDGLDFVLHDGSHQYKVLRQDLRKVMPKMKQNGIILVHDVCHEYEEMLSVLSHFVKKYNCEKVVLPYGYGLAILRVTKSMPFGVINIKEKKETKASTIKTQIKKQERNIEDSLILHQLKVLDKENPVVVHVGGFNGLRDLSINKCIPEATIHTIEASNKNFEFLKGYVQGNQQIRPYNLAIAGKTGKATLYIPQNERYQRCNLASQGTSLVNMHRGDDIEVIECPIETTTLDDFCSENSIDCIDWLTMNCEGAEYDIFKPLRPLEFLDKTNILDISFHGKYGAFATDEIIDQKIWLEAMLKDWGFIPVWGVSEKELRNKETKHVRRIWFRKDSI